MINSKTLQDIQSAQNLSFIEGVWAIVNMIPSGKVLGYGHIAALLGKPNHARRAGYAMSILPENTELAWWRAIRSDGSVPGTENSHRKLLQIKNLQSEKAFFKGTKVNMALSKWEPEIL